MNAVSVTIFLARVVQQWISNALGTAPDQDARARHGRQHADELSTKIYREKMCSACGRCQTLQPIILFGENETDSQN